MLRSSLVALTLLAALTACSNTTPVDAPAHPLLLHRKRLQRSRRHLLKPVRAPRMIGTTTLTIGMIVMMIGITVTMTVTTAMTTAVTTVMIVMTIATIKARHPKPAH